MDFFLKAKKQIPNIFTSLNLLSGCISIVLVFGNQLEWAAILILFATVFDFLDGFMARLLKAYSDIGKELDSLADLVTFGVAPSMIIFHYINQDILAFAADKEKLFFLLPFGAFLIAIFSAYRLAKFNVDTRQTESFIGLPTPANAIFILSIPLILNYSNPNSIITYWAAELSQSWPLLLLMTSILSYLLVAEIPLFSLKFKSFKWKENSIRFVFILIAVILLLIFRLSALPLIIISYIFISIINNILKIETTK